MAYVLGHPEVYLTAPSRVVQVWDGGYSFGVGLLVGVWALVRHARAHRCPRAGLLLDAAVPGVLIAQSLAALGRAVDALAAPLAPLPPWDQAARAATSSSPTAAPLPLATDALIAAPLATAGGVLALLLAYCVLDRRRPARIALRSLPLVSGAWPASHSPGARRRGARHVALVAGRRCRGSRPERAVSFSRARRGDHG